jgi:hypothetical protein
MKTRYLIWKNRSCNGVNPDWLEITGKDFLSLVRSTEGKGRYFVKLPSTEIDGNDGAMVMETTKKYYDEWKREKNHADYIRSFSKDRTIISYHAMTSDDGECFGEELLTDTEGDVETQFFKTHRLEMALSILTAEEQELVHHTHISEKRGTIRSYGVLTGASKSTVSRRQQVIFKKLKAFFED